MRKGDAERHGMHSHAERGNDQHAQALKNQVVPAGRLVLLWRCTPRHALSLSETHVDYIAQRII